MFVPAQYRAPAPAWTVDLVRRNPLAELVGNGTVHGGPLASHVPIILPPGDPPDDLTGVTLLGHMNRANPHWAGIGAGDTSVAIFTGPHAYVSPTLYETTEAAPTWDFTAVHLRGWTEPIPAGEQTLEVVVATVATFEPAFGDGWTMAGSLDHFRRIVPGVGAFRFTVSAVEAMFKLSQEQSPDVREHVRASFAGGPCTRRHEVADLIGRLPAGRRPEQEDHHDDLP